MIKKHLVMRIDELRHPEKNIRKHSRKQIEEMKRSLNMFEQFRPIVVDDTNTILCGNGLVIALREMGEEEAEVIQYEGLTENQKKKLMILAVLAVALILAVCGCKAKTPADAPTTAPTTT